jgi:hypothetical protein
VAGENEEFHGRRRALMGPRKNCGKREMGTQSRPLKYVKAVGLMVVDHKPSSMRTT